jgi:uncharacterized damage-inducible protein DinB
VDLIDHLRRQFVYDLWANRELLSAVRASRATRGRSLQLMAHILSAERLWLERLKQQPQSLPVWPELDLEECERQAAALGGLWREYLEAMPSSQLSQTISYKNSKGEPWASTVQDVLTHVVMHSAYHRGQMASHMRANGDTPAYTDFIHAVRQGLIE